MKFGFRKPSLKKRIAARTSLNRFAGHSLGLQAPRGMGWLTNPKKAAYNRIYNRTSRGCMVIMFGFAGFVLCMICCLTLSVAGDLEVGPVGGIHINSVLTEKFDAKVAEIHEN